MFWLRKKKNNFQLRTLIWGACVVVRADNYFRNAIRGSNGLDVDGRTGILLDLSLVQTVFKAIGY